MGRGDPYSMSERQNRPSSLGARSSASLVKIGNPEKSQIVTYIPLPGKSHSSDLAAIWEIPLGIKFSPTSFSGF